MSNSRCLPPQGIRGAVGVHLLAARHWDGAGCICPTAGGQGGLAVSRQLRFVLGAILLAAAGILKCLARKKDLEKDPAHKQHAALGGGEGGVNTKSAQDWAGKTV